MVRKRPVLRLAAGLSWRIRLTRKIRATIVDLFLHLSRIFRINIQRLEYLIE